MRIIDTFPFDGELMLLSHRLSEIYDLVDKIVLVEAAQTYRGRSKDLTFATHRERFSWAAAKLTHVKLATLGGASTSPRARAAIQRDALMLALRDLAPDDIVLLLDADEIPSASLLARLRSEGLTRPRRLSMTRHYQFLDTVGPSSSCCAVANAPLAALLPRIRPGNWAALGPRWHGQSGVAVPGRYLLGDRDLDVSAKTPFELRFGTSMEPSIADAGRHFSSVDPSARLEGKLERVFHVEWSGVRATAPVHLGRCRHYGIHHRGWWYAETPTGPLPADLSRLVTRSSAMVRRDPLPPLWRRRLLRSWAWLRLWTGWPDAMVSIIDERFEIVLPLLVIPLGLAAATRAACAAWAKGRSLRSRSDRRPHAHF